jgi:hypothetical protein
MTAILPFALSEIAATGYRSLRALRFPLRRLSVFVGANGTGKTNLYRALRLIQAAAGGSLSRALAAEGGMESAHWAAAGKLPAEVCLGREAVAALFQDAEAHQGVVDRGAGAGLPHGIGLGVAGIRPVALLARAGGEPLETHIGVFAADHPVTCHLNHPMADAPVAESGRGRGADL